MLLIGAFQQDNVNWASQQKGLCADLNQFTDVSWLLLKERYALVNVAL